MKSLQFKNAEYIYGEGVNIKYYRLKTGWTQKELADKARCQKSLISAIERGKDMNKSSELKICFALGKEPWELCRIRANHKKRKALVAKMQEAFHKKRRAERKAAGKKKKKQRRPSAPLVLIVHL